MQIAKFQLEDGRIASFEVPDGISPEAAQRLVAPQLAELSRTPAEAPKPVDEGLPEGGFVPAVKAGISSLKGNTAAVLGRVGAMDIGNAEQYIKEQEDYQKRTFKPSEQGWSEAPFTKFKETLGGSLPYIAAPAVAAVTALALPEAAVAAGAVTAASSLASYVQFVGSNLSRQMDEGKKLSETELGYAALSAIPQTALDVLSLKMLPGIGKIFGSAGKELTEEMAQKIAAQGLAKIVGEYTAKTGKAIGMEGLTEAAQQVFERLQAGLNITDEDAKKEYLESFIGGAVLGGVLAPVGNAFRRAGQAPKVAALEEQRLLRGKETDFETLKAKKLAEIREAGGVPEEDKPPEVDLNNIIGSISKEELHPEIVQHIDEHRKNMGHVPLSSYTIEDVKDAMPGTSPEHQQAIIDSILANKTKYRGDVQYTPDSLQTAAAGKNIDTKTQGFKDFLARTTGIEDESQMSQQQLHAAVTALTAMPKSEVIRSLPEGTNATRFSDAQYNNVVSKLQNENLGKYTRDDLVAKIKDISSLENNKDAHAILNKAIKDDEIDVNKTPQYDVVNPATNEIIASPSKKDVAQALADKNKFEMRESEKENFSLPQKEAYLPVGLEIKEEAVQDGEKPAGFEIRANDKVLSEAATQEEAQQKAADFTEVRRSALDEATKAMFKLQSGISASNKIITKLEATGKIGTPEYAKAKEAHDRLRQDSFKKINALRQDAVGYSKPVSVAPVAARPLMRKAHAVYEKGIKKTVASTRMAAERHILSTASDETLKQIAADKRPNRMTTKANKELAKRGVPQRDEVAAKAEAAELTQIQQLEASLVPTLAKFGLKDVALKVMKAINGNAEGSYESKLIKIALDSTNPMRVLRHESIHALKELGFFTPNQWKALENQARTQWIGKYLQNRNINGEKLQAGQQSRYDAYMDVYKGDMNAVVEEAIADAFGDFDVNGAPAGAMGKLMDMIRNFFVSLGNALRGAGFQTFEDVFGKVERGELKAGKVEAAGAKLSVGEESRGYKLEIEREKRKRARSASMSEDEFNAVTRDANALGLSDAQFDVVFKDILNNKRRFPASQGWAGLEVIGIESKLDDNEVVIPDSESPKYKPISYGYNVPPGSTKAPVKMDQEWLDKVTAKFQSQIEEIYKRAGKGDVNAKNIIAHKSWYKNVASTLREEYGGFGDTLADLLGATSPNTPVDTNWRFSMEIMRRFVRGDFNADMAKFVKHIDEGKSASDFPAADKIRQVSQKLYGMNSTNSMLALSDMWRMIKPGQAPKARNFALNLIGQSNMATIDVWAARMLRRAADMVSHTFPRIPPPAEQGVSGTWNSKATSVTGAFGFGAEVMRKTSDNLRKKGILIDPPDLQAIAWFAEKELWGTKGWTTKTGEGGSFEENIEAQPAERYIAGNAIQVGKVAPSQVDIKDSQKRILDILNEDKSVIASRSKQTKGLYGGVVEESFDTEWVVEKGKFKPEAVISEIAQISKDHSQFDFFVSKVLGKEEKSLNARPGVEIYFKTKQDMDTVMPILAAFTSKGQDGFTMAVDPRAADGTEQYMGIRLQYVPEISMRWNADLRRQLSVPGQLERVLIGKEKLLDKIVAQVAAMNGVASAITMRYDTLVIGKENYDEYIAGKPAAADSEPRTRVWFGQPIRSHVEAAASRYRAAEARQAALDDASGSEAKLSIRSGEPAIRPGGGSDERSGVVLGKKQEGSATFNGVHYGRVKTDKLDAAKYGTGLQGSEARRLRDYWDDRIKKRVYFYIPKYDGTMPLPESGIGGHVYTQRFNNIASPAAMSKLYAEARGDANTMESLVVDAGYDGYAAPSMGMMVILNHDVPVNYEGIRSEYEAKTGQTGVQKFETDKFKQEKLSLRAPTTPEFKRFFDDSKVVDENGEPLVVSHISKAEPTVFDKRYKTELSSMGFHFGTKEQAQRRGAQYDFKSSSPTTGDYYLSIKKPLEVSHMASYAPDHLADKMMDMDLITEEKYASFRDKYLDEPDIGAALVKILQKAGYDGLVYSNEKEGNGNSYVPFEPTQIKSATGNIGTYDPTNPDIRYSLRKAPEWVPQNIWDLHEKASRADAESMGTAPSRVNAKDQAFSPGALKRNQVMSFRRLNDAVEKYVGNNEDDANALMVRMNQESGRREAEAPIRYSLREFKESDLPKNKQTYTIPANTLLFHGAHKKQADKIESAGKILLARPTVKTSGGAPNEGGLIFFGEKQTAEVWANNLGDPLSVMYDEEAGNKRENGVVFQTETDRPYKLINKNYKLSKVEADALTKVFGLPDYKRISAGDTAGAAAGRADNFSKSTAPRYTVTKSGVEQEMSAPWPIIFDTLGVDGYFDDFGLAFKADNGIRLVGKEGRMERFSLRNQINAMPNGAAILTRLNETTTVRDEATHAQRMIDAIHPRNASSYRQKLIYRYQRIGEGTRARALTLGEQELLADVSAEAAALQSDMAAGMSASALGIGDRKGGIPVYKNGYTTIDNSVKGAVETFVPLAKSGDPLIYQLYQYWAGVKRGSRLMAPSPGHPNGREELFTQADVAYAKQIEADHPEFVGVQKDWIAYNNGLVRYMVDTGTITEAAGIEFMKHGDYLPFYRQLDGERTAGPQIFQSIAGVKPPKALKGGKAELADFLETVVRNTQAAIQSGMKNVAGQRVVRDAVDTKTAEKLPHFQSAYDVVTIMEKGLKTSYRVADPLLIEAMKGLNLPDIPFLSMVSGPANLLRNMVTKDPGFMLANMMKDSIGTWVQSGTKMKPITETVLQFGKALAGKSKEVEALLNAGFGGYEFSGNVEQNGRDLAKDLRKKTGTRTTSETAFRPFTSLWGALEKGSQASELATRAAVYKRVMDETGNEAEALHRALEVMNFNRKGNSALIRVLTAAVPFLNARMQGLDLLYRSAFGQMALKDAKSIQKAFFIRGATLMALSCFYYAMTHDDDEYKKQEQETRDNNWLIPSLGIKIPIPFEIGVLFKVVPERILAYAFGSDTGQDFLKSMGRQISSTLGFNPIPQAVLPIVENVANYSFFTSRTIIPRAMEGIDPKFQIQQSTSGLAMKIGKELGMSPIKIDHLINGYTGTLGVYMSSALNSIFDSNDDPTRADLRLYQMPVIKRFMLDPDAKGTVSEYFDLKHSVDQVVRTSNMLERTSNFKEMGQYATENIKILATQDYVKDLANDMKELQEFSVMIRSSNMDSASKRDALDNISKAQNALTANIQTIRKFTQQ